MAKTSNGTDGYNKFKYAPIAAEIAGGANTNSIFCAIPAINPKCFPKPRFAYSNAPPALGIAQAISV